jgi:hypothetical protein
MCWQSTRNLVGGVCLTIYDDVMELRPEVIILRSWIVDLIIGLIYACHDTQVVTMTNFVRSKLSSLNYTKLILYRQLNCLVSSNTTQV